jgi:lipopolysaccharide export system protein LptC
MAPETPPRDADAKPVKSDRWAMRMRTDAMQALRYTRFVTLMRRALPTAAIAILGVVVAYAMFPGKSERVALSYQKMNGVVGDLAMQKPRLSGVDAKGNPYVITADVAVQQGRNSRKVALNKVDADLQYDGGNWANASAGKGFVDLDAGWLRLTDGISLYTDGGYELHTKSAYADLKKNMIEGKERVNGHGPLGSIAADSFHIDRNTRRLTLHGRVRMTMLPKKVKR